jgi:exopolysaccharide biosynthesis polyprenyl glycosylphosphotransferase
MIRERQRGAVSIHALFQAVAVFACFAGWFAIVTLFGGKALLGGFTAYSFYALIAIASLLLRAAYCANDDAARLSGLFPARLNLAARQTLFIGIVMAVFLVATKDKEISRVFLFSWLPILYVTLAATNLAMPHFVLPLVFSKSTRQSFLLVTRDTELRKEERLTAWLRRQQRMGITVVGIAAPEGFKTGEMQANILGSPHEIERIFYTYKPDVLMWMEPPADHRELMLALELAESQGSRLIFWDDLEHRFGARAWSAEIDGLNFVHFRREPLESPLNRATKRLFDIIIASIALFLAMPLLCVFVWVLHRLQSRGPLFFRQKRTGLGGQQFEIFKFRTMHTGSESDSRQASQNDVRIFSAGRWLRKTSLDEVPQFLNVLRGEMSVVGPRPHLPEHNSNWARLLNAYNVRSIVKPGLTGLAQVRGMRGEAKTDDDIVRRIESDLEYIENYSPLVDIVIVGQTAWQIFFPRKTAY